MAAMPDPDTGDDTSVGPDRGSTVGTPLWVKVFGLIALVVVLVFVVLLLTGRGHGPGRHTSADAGHTPPAGHMEQQ
jgi:ABC-type transporter Mla subunit MlaD